jgi:hypothetical protein
MKDEGRGMKDEGRGERAVARLSQPIDLSSLTGLQLYNLTIRDRGWQTCLKSSCQKCRIQHGHSRVESVKIKKAAAPSQILYA